jgi:hypothetical protein
MATKKIIVKGDAVEGTDTHKVTGTATVPPPTSSVTYTGTATYEYKGTMTDALSDFVTIGGDAPVATVDSRSALSSAHIATNGAEPFDPPKVPSTLEPVPGSFSFTGNADGTGAPSDRTGSSFVTITVGRTTSAVLLDGDKIDTCGEELGTGNSTVTSSKQSFVTVTE